MLLDDKTILITGGTGSFGKCFYEICADSLSSEEDYYLFQR